MALSTTEFIDKWLERDSISGQRALEMKADLEEMMREAASHAPPYRFTFTNMKPIGPDGKAL